MIAWWDGLHFARPLWLWALLSLPVLAGCWWARRRAANVWHTAIDPHLLPHLIERRVDRGGWLGLAAWMLAALSAVLALAGPGWRQLPAPLQGATSAPLVVALDLSTATSAGDLPPSRLLQARAKLARVFAARAGAETALLVFADDAFTVAPLTEDTANLALYLDALSPDIMPADGQRADRAIERATRLLRQRGVTQGAILLMTSEADGAAIAEAATALRMGYRVSALGLGTPDGAAHRDASGGLAHTRLEAASLEALAMAGGGRYSGLTADDADLRALDVQATGAGSADPAGAPTPGPESALRWADQGYWFVLPLLVLVLLAFRRGGALASVACAALLFPLMPAIAQSIAPEGTPWRRADQVAHARMVEGAEAYRAGRYADAAQRWAGLPGAEAAYNRGNALAKQGELDAAIDAYDEALRLRPGMADAEANRAAVDAARQRTPPPGPGQDPRAPPRGQSQAAGRPGSGDGAPSPDASPRPSPPAGTVTPPPPAPSTPSASEPVDASPADVEAQREADAAQHERMQRALDARDAGDGTPRPGPPDAAPEDRAGAERRQANEALLRRLPDDPGGLLRAKFRLEHERRRSGDPR